MKYRFLLKFLRALIYLKRGLWWSGRQIQRFLGRAVFWFLSPVVWCRLKMRFLLKKLGLGTGTEWATRRGLLQMAPFIVIIIIAVPQTKLFAKPDPLLSGQKTIAYRLVGEGEEFDVQEFAAEPLAPAPATPAWRAGAVGAVTGRSAGQVVYQQPDLMSTLAGGTALGKPILLPSAGVAGRSGIVTYEIQIGDSLSTIAEEFGVSIATILWENGLRETSIIRPGQALKIPPVTGLTHTIKKGDTLGKIALLYKVEADKIASFNNLRPDGTNLVIGSKIIIPGGIKPAAPRAAPTQATIARRAAPPASLGSPSAAGYVWPSRARTITQYFSWKHHALDIAGPWQSANYAAKAGVVEKAQCGWNSGYGCVIIIDHGGGLKTLYGHNSKLLVSPGEYVDTGQTIGLMGNTGRVYGVTGIHLHFEVIVSGARVNPLKYVR